MHYFKQHRTTETRERERSKGKEETARKRRIEKRKKRIIRTRQDDGKTDWETSSTTKKRKIKKQV